MEEANSIDDNSCLLPRSGTVGKQVIICRAAPLSLRVDDTLQ